MVSSFVSIIISIVIPTGLMIFLPIFLKGWLKRDISHNGWLVIACFLFFISWYVPSPLIEGRNTSYMTHFWGGGIFTGFLWLYVKSNLTLRGCWWEELGSLYFLTCGLGVANELFEVFTTKIGLTHHRLTDTHWDLVANTLGMLVFWALYRLLATQKREPHQ